MLMRGTESKLQRAEVGEMACPLHCHPPQSWEAPAPRGLGRQQSCWCSLVPLCCLSPAQDQTTCKYILFCAPKTSSNPAESLSCSQGCCGKMEGSPYENRATLPR